MAEINAAGVRLAREAVVHVKEKQAGEAWVAGAVGPLGVRLEPLGKTGLDEARAAFVEQIRALAAAGVDMLIVETMPALNEAREALLAAEEAAPGLPVLVMVTVDDEGNCLDGSSPEQAAALLTEWGAHARGRELLDRAVDRADRYGSDARGDHAAYRGHAERWYAAGGGGAQHLSLLAGVYGQLCAQGDRGGSADRGRLLRHDAQPHPGHALGDAGDRCAGAQGGRRSARRVNDRDSAGAARPAVAHWSAGGAGHVYLPGGDRAAAGHQLRAGDRRQRKLLAQLGVHAINVPDSPRASARMSAQSLCIQIQQQTGIETILHYTCRDRNILSIQSDLLGASSIGLHNILCLTGDPPKLGNYPDATAVFDVDAIGLVNIVQRLNHGLDIGNNSIGASTNFTIGVAANPGVPDIEHELRRFQYKVEAGAEYVITQPVFDLRLLEDFLKRIRGMRIPVIAGIWPLTSLRNAEFMKNDLRVSMPEEIMLRMAQADTPDAARREGIKIAQEMLEAVRPMVEGVQVSAPFGRYTTAAEVIASVLPLPASEPAAIEG